MSEVNPVVPVASPTPTASSTSPALAFAGIIEPTEVSLAYKIGLAVVAFGMVLLPTIYFALIVLAAYGVYFHIMNDGGLLNGSGGGWARMLLYFGPIVAGVILIFFMIKPFFARRQKQPARYSLTHQSDPVLFAFILRLCELLKAPVPSRVDVDCQVNASASFRRGLASLGSNDVVLTIGLPLAAGMTMQEFAGVLAHEFGHFTQGAGMRLTYVIRQTNAWFARVVYERDEWDMKLEQMARGLDIRLAIFLHLGRFCVWLSRRILWALMYAGHAMSCFMLRQMEYDADSYETKLAGSAAFGRTSEKIRNLAIASQWAYHKMEESWRNRRLPDNLPGFIKHSINHVPAEVWKKVEAGADKKKTGVFDTHPCDADRIRAAEALKQPGIFHLTDPASALFNDFAGLSKAATRMHYENNLELKITDQNLVAQEETAKENEFEVQGETALREFFFGLNWVYRPILISQPASAFTDNLLHDLKTARLAMEQSKPQVEKTLAEYEQAEALYQRGLDALLQGSEQAITSAAATMQSLAPALQKFETLAQNRLVAALQLLLDAETAGKLPDAAALQQESAALIPAFEKLGRAFPLLQELRRKFNAFAAALNAINQKKLAAIANTRVYQLSPELEALMKQIAEIIKGVPYPLKHARGNITFDQFIETESSALHPLQAVYNNCNCYIDRLLPLYFRILGRLAFIALKVEAGCGLPPVKLPAQSAP